MKQVYLWLLGAQRGPKNTLLECHSSAVNICRFTCSFPLPSSISLVLSLCANRHCNCLTNTKKQTAQFPFFQLEQLVNSDKPLNISVNLVFRGHTACPSHSYGFIIASKIFNPPSGYSDNRKAIKSYSLKK